MVLIEIHRMYRKELTGMLNRILQVPTSYCIWHSSKLLYILSRDSMIIS